MSDLCQVCIEHDCASHMGGVSQCEGFKPPWRDIPCDLCHIPTNPFHLQKVKRGERTLLVCNRCVEGAVNHFIDAVEKAAQEAAQEAKKTYSLGGKAIREHHDWFDWPRMTIDFHFFVGHCQATSDEEALGEAYTRCYEHFPIAEGWQQHQAIITEIKRNTAQEARGER